MLFLNSKRLYEQKRYLHQPLVQRVQLSSEETVQWHKLWQLPDTNLPRQLQYINVLHQRKNKLSETLSQVLFVESNHLNYPQIMPPHSTCRLQLMPPTQNSSSSTSLVQMRANTHYSSSVTDVVDILDVIMMIYLVIITLLQ